MTATLVITAPDNIGDTVACLAEEHAAFDRRRRQIVRRGDAAYPGDEVIAAWGNPHAVAVMLDEHDVPVVFLNRTYATCEAWIEDAFVRAIRTDNDR